MKITEVAIKAKTDDKVWSLEKPNRHHNVIWLMRENGYAKGWMGEQGFVTDKGTFVSRREAMVIAAEAGQLNPERAKDSGHPGTLGQLFSEDLW